MSEVNLGRVQGGGIFYSTASSGTSIAKSTLTPTGLVPLVGDCVVFPNGDLRKITAVSGTNVTCGSVAANFKGDKGDTGTTSSIVKTAAEWESQNPVLGAGVFGYDSTNDITKIGDGTPHGLISILLKRSRNLLLPIPIGRQSPSCRKTGRLKPFSASATKRRSRSRRANRLLLSFSTSITTTSRAAAKRA